MGNLKIFLTNIRSLRSNYNELLLYVHGCCEDYDVIVLTEIWITENEITLYHIPGYKIIISANETQRAGGVLIYVKNNLTYSHMVTKSHSFEGINLNLKFGTRTISFLAIYRSPSQPIAEFLQELETVLESDISPTYLLGDINIDILQQQQLYVEQYLNLTSSLGYEMLIKEPTRVTSNTSTCIDHLASRFTTFLTNTSYSVIQTSITDHFSINLNIKVCESHHPAHLNYPELKTFVDFNKLESELNVDHRFLEVFNCVSTQEGFDLFYEIFNECVTRSTRVVKNKNKFRKRSPWITHELVTRCNYKNRLYSLVKKHPFSLNLKTEYDLVKRELAADITVAKKHFYGEKINNARGNSREYWKILNSLRVEQKEDLVEIKDEDENLVTVAGNEKFVANLFNKHYINTAVNLLNELNYNTSTVNHTVPVRQCIRHIPSSIVLNPVTKEEIIQIIKSMKNQYSAGFDKINIFLIKQNLNVITPVLVHLFNLSLTEGVYPDQLKLAIVTPIYKKGSRHLIQNFRPISVLSTLSKILETCFKSRLMSFLNKYNFFSKNQFGFLSGRGTDLCLYKHVESLVQALEKNLITCSVYLDLAKAFDVVAHEMLLNKLRTAGCRGPAYSWVKSYFHNRHQCVKINNVLSDNQIISHGVPQGSVLGPIFFLVYINDLCELPLRSKLFSFADDTALVITGQDSRHLKLNFQYDFRLISHWFTCNKMILNTTKTSLVNFSYSNRPRPPLQLTLHKLTCTNYNVDNTDNCGDDNCCIVVEQTNVKYLGVVIDFQLKWQSHLQHLQTRLRQINYAFYQFQQFLDINTLKLLYLAWYQSILSYGILHWGGTFNSHLSALQYLQNKTVRIITNKRKRDSVTDVYKNLNISPLTSLYQQTVCKFVCRHYSHFQKHKCYSSRNITKYHLLTPFYKKTHSRHNSSFTAPTIFNTYITPTQHNLTFHNYTQQHRLTIIKNLFKNKT